MKLSATARKMVLVIGVSALVFIAASAVFYRSWAFAPFAAGALTGAVVSALKVCLLDIAVGQADRVAPERGGLYFGLLYLLRFGLTGLALLAGAFAPFLSLWGVAAGVVTMQIAALSMKFFAPPEKPSQAEA